MCARHGRGAIAICLSEKRALAKKVWETLCYYTVTKSLAKWQLSYLCVLFVSHSNIRQNKWFLSGGKNSSTDL